MNSRLILPNSLYDLDDDAKLELEGREEIENHAQVLKSLDKRYIDGKET